MLLTKFANLAFANVYSMLMNSCSMLVSTIISGHLGDERMQAGLGISNSVCFICLLSVFYGLNRSLDTLHTTAFGAGDFKLCGVYLNRGRYVNTLFYIPLALLLYFT